MSRNIPSIKPWRVSYYTIESKPIVCGIRRRIIATCIVHAINKRFARWNAQEKIGYIASYSLKLDKPVFSRVGRIRKEKATT